MGSRSSGTEHYLGLGTAQCSVLFKWKDLTGGHEHSFLFTFGTDEGSDFAVYTK